MKNLPPCSQHSQCKLFHLDHQGPFLFLSPGDEACLCSEKQMFAVVLENVSCMLLHAELNLNIWQPWNDGCFQSVVGVGRITGSISATVQKHQQNNDGIKGRARDSSGFHLLLERSDARSLNLGLYHLISFYTIIYIIICLDIFYTLHSHIYCI